MNWKVQMTHKIISGFVPTNVAGNVQITDQKYLLCVHTLSRRLGKNVHIHVTRTWNMLIWFVWHLQIWMYPRSAETWNASFYSGDRADVSMLASTSPRWKSQMLRFRFFDESRGSRSWNVSQRVQFAWRQNDLIYSCWSVTGWSGRRALL